MSGPVGSADDPVNRRVTAVLAVAAQFQTEVALADLPVLLPSEGPSDPAAVARWVREHPTVARIEGSNVVRPQAAATPPGELADRRARGLDYLSAARGLFEGPLARIGPEVRCACVTGSTAYHEPAAGDDVDLMVVTAADSMWYTLLRIFLTMRSERRRSGGGDRPWCVNYVLDEREARRAYADSRGFLFAREALTAHPVAGHEYYTSLIREASWMQDELPRMYRTWAAETAESAAPAPPSLGLRVANALVYPLLASYLQLVGLRRNSLLRRAGRGDEGFRTITRARQFALQTLKFDQLQGMVEATPHAGHREPAA